MPLPRIAIIGRPNVGKSSLLNRLAKRRVSIVDPTPGVTRDRVSAMVEIAPPLGVSSAGRARGGRSRGPAREARRRSGTRGGGRPAGTIDDDALLLEVIDTGGYGVYTAEGKRYDDIGADLATLTPDIEAQIAAARRDADLILFVIDAQSGITALDEMIADIIRREGHSAKVLVVANKVDGDQWIAHGAEASRLGFGEPVCVSAHVGYNVRQLRELLYARLKALGRRSENHVTTDGSESRGTTGAAPELKFAIVGKRNSGKSTLINTLAGEQRVIVSEIAGTTRDSIDVLFGLDGRSMLAIDTAGLRKRKSFADDVEFYAFSRMVDAIKRADVAMLLIDATQDVSQVDQKLASELMDQHKPTVIVVNKWDLVDQSQVRTEQFLEYLTKRLGALEFAPVVFISAAKGEGVRDVVAMAWNLFQQAGHRESTSKLNEAIEQIMSQRGPSSRLGTHAKLYYATQVATHPPTIAIVVNDPKLFVGQYERYLLNALREILPYSEVPIRLLFRARKRKTLEELKAGGRRERGGEGY
jgi:GTP-binding protein